MASHESVNSQRPPAFAWSPFLEPTLFLLPRRGSRHTSGAGEGAGILPASCFPDLRPQHCLGLSHNWSLFLIHRHTKNPRQPPAAERFLPGRFVDMHVLPSRRPPLSSLTLQGSNYPGRGGCLLDLPFHTSGLVWTGALCLSGSPKKFLGTLFREILGGLDHENLPSTSNPV